MICRYVPVFKRNMNAYVCWNPFRNVSSVWKISYLSAGTIYPGIKISLINTGISLGAIVLLAGLPWKGRPLAIYLILCSTIHLINSLWFVFEKNIFRILFNRLFKIIYASGNWHMGDVFCHDSYGHRNNRRQGVIYKLLTLLAIMLYSIVFGTVRYASYLAVVQIFCIYGIFLLYDRSYVRLFISGYDLCSVCQPHDRYLRFKEGKGGMEMVVAIMKRLYYFCYYSDASVHSQTFYFTIVRLLGRQRLYYNDILYRQDEKYFRTDSYA